MNKTLEEIANHVEFLGYKVTKTKAEKEGEKDFILAIHSSRNNFSAIASLPGFFNFQTQLTTEKTPSKEMDDFVNKANPKMDISRFFYKVEKELAVLVFESMYIGEYDKEKFSKFYELMENDQKRIGLLENFNQIFLK